MCLAQWLANVPATGDLAFLVALYSLGAYERRRWILVPVVVVAEVGVVMDLARWGSAADHPLQGLLSTGTVTSAWVAGIYVRMRRAYLVSALQRPRRRRLPQVLQPAARQWRTAASQRPSGTVP